MMAGRTMFFKIRRVTELLTFGFFLLIIYGMYLHWSETSSIHIDDDNNNNNHENIPQEQQSRGRSDLPKYIHLDLKGAPPKAEQFYEKFFDFLEKLQMGVKGLVIEYEDTLPLQGYLTNISHANSYTKSDIRLICESAKKHQLDIIPLIQTFGHLEWILKLEEYQNYRDHPDLPTVISPCWNQTYVLLEDLLQQTLDLHPDSKVIHIGCDEVSLTHANKQCQLKFVNTYEIYIKHIERVVSIVRKIRPGIRILIWDDILRHNELITNRKLLELLRNEIEPVSWNYFTQFNENYKSSLAWKTYPTYFEHHWIASAFKGGLHRYSMITNTSHHVQNNQQWLNFIDSSAFQKLHFYGIILTGWSRFDHFMPLCDLLPTAYASLLLSLHVLNTNELILLNSISSCERLLKMIGKDRQLCEIIPGLAIWENLNSFSYQLTNIRKQIKLLDTIAPEYNRKHLFVRLYELKRFLSDLKESQRYFLFIKQRLISQLAALYTDDVITEWMGLYFEPLERQMNRTFDEFQPILNRTIWPKRPLISPNNPKP